AICATAESWERLLRGVPGLSPPMIDWAFIFCALAAAAVYVWQAGRKYQTHHLDCRALAEGLRVQLFWSIAGVRECVADHYLRKHRGELEWIRSAIRAATINVNCHTTENVSPPRAIEIVEKYWIDSQENFFKRKGESQHHTAHRVGLFLHVSLVIGFVAELVKAIVHRHPDAQVPVQLDGAIAAAEALVATAGALKIAVKTLALAEQSKQYERMATIFATARTRLKGGDADQAIFSELGREALTENADWLLLHRQRPLEMPAA
ncbi:MAG TPA: hypothetical protein VKK61_06915, partial [Tepidisphaeraceae bacterium]|nr:hypothetical protein [Tepidisphaeraceae bacterium]